MPMANSIPKCRRWENKSDSADEPTLGLENSTPGDKTGLSGTHASSESASLPDKARSGARTNDHQQKTAPLADFRSGAVEDRLTLFYGCCPLPIFAARPSTFNTPSSASIR